MKRFFLILSLSCALLPTGCGQNGHAGPFKADGSDVITEEEVRETTYYKNGVFRTDGRIYSLFHSDDWIFGISGDRMIESSDLTHWLRMGKSAFEADSLQVACSSGLDIARIGDSYVMAYVSPDGSIRTAQSSRIRGPYSGGKVLLGPSEKNGAGLANPSFFCTGDSVWLLWDNPDGINMGRLAWTDRTSAVSDVRRIGAPEFFAPKIIEKYGRYYLLASLRRDKGGIVVGRSNTIGGPYHTSEGTAMTTGGPVTPTIIPNSEFSNLSNSSALITDTKNEDWIIYHARPAMSEKTQTVLMLDKIMWDNGWPVMGKRHASVASQRSPIF